MDLRGTDGPRLAPRTPAAAGDRTVSGTARVAPPGRARRDRWQRGDEESTDAGSKAVQPDTGRSDQTPTDDTSPETSPTQPTPPEAVPAAVYLQAVDPATGSVIWQAPLPRDPVETLPAHSPDSPAPGPDPRSIGAIARQAYAAQDEESDIPHIVRTA